jgi:serine/threonine-protein kinase
LKACGACFRLYPDEGGFCPVDGTRLVPTGEIAPPNDPKDPRVGATLCGGRYRVYRIVADGGMGRVYQAFDLAQQRTVALKILHPDVATDRVAVERFKREFELSAALGHEHIVEVFAFEHTEDQSYALVMEYLEGEELRTLLKREKTLPPARVIRMISQMAMGLEPPHQRKIVHRDLKPDNVFLCGTRDGDIVKILDFGSVRDNSEGAKKLTVMGTTIGSPFYMAPEQAQGLQTLDHRADVWSVAAIAYESLTGVVPFRGTTGPAILLAILTKEATPPSEVGREHGVPATLDAVMEEALVKNPAIRIPTVGALADRIGAAYGLSGSHRQWAKMPQEALDAAVREGLPAALAKHSSGGGAADLGAMDQAFAAAAPRPAGAGEAATFSEDLVMGVPSGPPRWLVPVVAVAAVVVGIVIAVAMIHR